MVIEMRQQEFSRIFQLREWPVEVSLPIDPEWKKDYAASVRWLIRDGVDVPLANLFVHAARSSYAVEGKDRARSASEAFLFRRLESLPGTKGRFGLSVEWPTWLLR